MKPSAALILNNMYIHYHPSAKTRACEQGRVENMPVK